MNDLKGIIEDCNKSDLVSEKVIKKVIEIIGQEEWNDLHDENSDICTTMGELIITLKGIPELEGKDLEIKTLGERCNQLLKDKGDLTDKNKQLELIILGNQEEIAELEQESNKLLDVINNQDAKIADLEQQIEKMKLCEICEYGGNAWRICYSEELCNNRDKWKLSHRFSEIKEYRK